VSRQKALSNQILSAFFPPIGVAMTSKCNSFFKTYSSSKFKSYLISSPRENHFNSTHLFSKISLKDKVINNALKQPRE